jgi:hypothetical protein
MSIERPPLWGVVALVGWATLVYGVWALGYLR